MRLRACASFYVLARAPICLSVPLRCFSCVSTVITCAFSALLVCACCFLCARSCFAAHSRASVCSAAPLPSVHAVRPFEPGRPLSTRANCTSKTAQSPPADMSHRIPYNIPYNLLPRACLTESHETICPAQRIRFFRPCLSWQARAAARAAAARDAAYRTAAKAVEANLRQAGRPAAHGSFCFFLFTPIFTYGHTPC